MALAFCIVWPYYDAIDRWAMWHSVGGPFRMMEILLVVLAATSAHANPVAPPLLLAETPASSEAPVCGGLAALAVGGLSLAARVRRR